MADGRPGVRGILVGFVPSRDAIAGVVVPGAWDAAMDAGRRVYPYRLVVRTVDAIGEPVDVISLGD